MVASFSFNRASLKYCNRRGGSFCAQEYQKSRLARLQVGTLTDSKTLKCKSPISLLAQSLPCQNPRRCLPSRQPHDTRSW